MNMTPASRIRGIGRWFSGYQDLSLGKPYTVGAQWPDPLFAQTERDRYPDTGQLTGGLTPGPAVADPAWIACLRQYGRSIVLDLGSVCDIRRIEISYLRASGAGVYPPLKTHGYVSLDRTSWFTVGEQFSPAPDRPAQPGVEVLSWEVCLQARFVRLQFTPAIYVFVGNWRVLGYARPRHDAREPDGEALTLFMGQDYLVDTRDASLGGPPDILTPGHIHKEESAPVDWRHPAGTGDPLTFPRGCLRATDGASGGIRNLELVYSGKFSAGTTWSVDDFIPMVGQFDDGGVVSDWLFDGSLFLPYAKMPTTAEAWTDWLTDLFNPGVQLHALNEAVLQVGETLEDGSFTHKVVLALPGTGADPENFGQIPGGLGSTTVNMDPRMVGYSQAAGHRLAALEWFLEDIVTRWQQTPFSRLQLVGLYWQPEAIRTDDPYDRWLISRIAQKVHAAGLLFYWIPYFGAPGIPEARQLGFDAVMIQPHVAFEPLLDPDERLGRTAKLAEWYGQGIEMELHWDIHNARRPDLVQRALGRFQDYLDRASRYGYSGDVAKSWYLGSKSLVECYRSPDPVTHRAYTDTVRFVRGVY